MTRDGIVVREEQLAQYPQIADDIPDTNPRGCQKGAIHSQAMYESDRIRYPMKRVGERGEKVSGSVSPGTRLPRRLPTG